MLPGRLATLAAVLLVGGVALATLAPVLPFQEPGVQATKEHKLIVKGAGDYEGTLTWSMPGMPEPMVSPCTEKVIAIGDFWTISHFEMEFMGAPFSGSSSMGYDPERKKFIGTWIDSMSPRVTHMEGEWNDEKQAIVMEYDMYDQMAGAMVRMRSVNHFTDDGYTLKFYRLTEEGAQDDMSIAMKRK